MHEDIAAFIQNGLGIVFQLDELFNEAGFNVNNPDELLSIVTRISTRLESLTELAGDMDEQLRRAIVQNAFN